MKTTVKNFGAVKAEPRRGRPRNLELREAVLRAARDLLDQVGPSGVTMEAVAARAGVSKPTVYRWWSNRHAVTMAALMESELPGARTRRSESPVHALSQQLRGIVDTLASRTGRNVATLIAAADPDTELSKAFRNHFVLARREEGRVLLMKAADLGEIRCDVNLEVTLDMIYGPLFFRLLLGHAPLDAAFVNGLIASLLRGLSICPQA
jgi:AcrR family transcriptional regulator